VQQHRRAADHDPRTTPPAPSATGS
jgi:hypothetical protein